jgi:ferredoxin-NADP reductase
MRLSAQGPGGEFSCFGTPEVAAPLLFLSAGSGITPLMSMARAFHDLGHDVDLHFLHAARTPADVIFAEELGLMARNMPGFNLGLICEQRGKVSTYAGMLGRINLLRLQSQVPDFAGRAIYCCGPTPFMAAMRDMLLSAGYDMRRYREESFNFETLSADAAVPAGEAAAEAAAQSFEVRFAKRGDIFRCAADQTILQAAQAVGLRVPYSCAQGICGTCRTVKTSGEVVMNDNGGLRPREIRQGWILPCCSKPTSDLVLDR